MIGRFPMPRLVALLVIAPCLLASCSSDPRRGYAFSWRNSADARTISVPMFDNQTYDSGVEFELTEALIKEIQRSTRLGVTRGSDADTTLTGVIRKSEMHTIARDSTTGLANHTAVVISIDFEWKDNRSGEVLVSKRNFSAADTFVPARPTGEMREAAVHGVVDQLARDIVGQLHGAW